MKQALLALTFWLLAICTVKAQQDPVFTHYMFNQNVYNPAFVGIEMKDKMCVNLVHREQWLGFVPTEPDGSAPMTTAFNMHTPFTLKFLPNKRFGVGLVFLNDELGFESNTWAQASLSYHHLLKNNANLSVGANFGVIQKSIGTDKLRWLDEEDIVRNRISNDGKDMILDFGLGLLYTTKKYYVGFSTLHLPQSTYEWYGGEDENNQLMRHYYINAGYNYKLSEFLELQPRMLLKMDRAKWQVDLGALLEYNKKYWGGLNLRRGEGIMILAGLTAKSSPKDELRIGVSYDLTLSQLGSVSDGSLEFMVNYCFRISLKPQMPKPQFSPRFLEGYTR